MTSTESFVDAASYLCMDEWAEEGMYSQIYICSNIADVLEQEVLRNDIIHNQAITSKPFILYLL